VELVENRFESLFYYNLQPFTFLSVVRGGGVVVIEKRRKKRQKGVDIK